MSLYYCPIHQGFYDATIHSTIPATAIAITPEQHVKFLAALNAGSLILPDATAPSGCVITPPRPSPHHQWDSIAHQWDLPPAAAAALLAEAKAAKLAQLNAAAQAHIDRAARLDQTPDFEVRTWALQAAEAKAWAADHNAPTPILDTIATARGVPAELLKQKALEKAQAFEQLTATVAGRRQAAEDRIHAATDMLMLNQIELPFMAAAD